MSVTEIFTGSPDYAATLELRNEVLRKPIGLVLQPSEIDAERSDWHFAASDGDGRLWGCVVLRPLGDGVAKLRQMAVAEVAQRTGVGSALVRYAEQTAIARGVHTVTMAARVTAISFYERLGYTVSGETFVEVGLPHVTMNKLLDS